MNQNDIYKRMPSALHVLQNTGYVLDTSELEKELDKILFNIKDLDADGLESNIFLKSANKILTDIPNWYNYTVYRNAVSKIIREKGFDYVDFVNDSSTDGCLIRCKYSDDIRMQSKKDDIDELNASLSEMNILVEKYYTEYHNGYDGPFEGELIFKRRQAADMFINVAKTRGWSTEQEVMTVPDLPPVKTKSIIIYTVKIHLPIEIK